MSSICATWWSSRANSRIYPYRSTSKLGALELFVKNTQAYFQKAHNSPAHAKISFVSIWFAFAVALWILNKKKDRQVFDEISKNEKYSAEILVITGK